MAGLSKLITNSAQAEARARAELGKKPDEQKTSINRKEKSDEEKTFTTIQKGKKNNPSVLQRKVILTDRKHLSIKQGKSVNRKEEKYTGWSLDKP